MTSSPPFRSGAKVLPGALAAALVAMTGSAQAAAPRQHAVLAETAGEAVMASNLALPVDTGLTGARDAPVFAWLEDKAGVRNVWIAQAGGQGQRRTDYTLDDGVELSGLALSADGTRIAFVHGGDPEFPDGSLPNAGAAPETPDQAVFVASTQGRDAPTRVGQGHSPVFSPDGRRLAFTQKGALYVWDGAQARQIAKVEGSIGTLTWTPDGSTLLFREIRPGHSLIGVIGADGKGLRYFGATLGWATDPVLSPDGRKIAWISLREPPAELPDSDASFWSIHEADLATGKAETVWTAPQGAGGQYWGTRRRNLYWTKDGTLLFPWERTGWMHVYALRPGDGPARDLTPDANEVEAFLPGPDGQSLIYAANPGDLDTRSIWRVGLAGGKPQRLSPQTAFTFYPVLAGKALGATQTDVMHPAHPVLVAGNKPMGPVATARDMTTPRAVTFRSSDGLTIHGQVFQGRGDGPHPALVFVHGGPHRQMLPGFHPMQYYSNAYVRNQAFAAEGFTVLSVNYRSGTNYGHDFRDAPNIARAGASEYRDVLAGAKWLASRSDVDGARIGIWGGSWGGYLTALALARNSDIFKVGVDMHGVHAMVRPVSPTIAPDKIAQVQQLQWDSSPMGSIAKWRSPVLIVHGDDDSNVDFNQSLLLARELDARHVPFKELVLPDERHEFFRYADWLRAYRASGDFVIHELADKKTGG